MRSETISHIAHIAGSVIRHVPGPLLHPLVRPFRAGASLRDAVAWGARMNERRFSVTIDLAGEDVAYSDEVTNASINYGTLADKIARAGVRAGIAIKVSNFGIFKLERKKKVTAADPRLQKYGTDKLKKLSAETAARHIRMWIDAESLMARELTWETVWEILKSNPAASGNLGVCMQAYAPDAVPFLKSQIDNGWHGPIRIVMGAAYPGNARIITDNTLLEENFFAVAEAAADAECFIQAGTHRRHVQQEFAKRFRDAPHESGLLKWVEPQLACELRDNGEHVDIYGPTGPAKTMRTYVARRIEENPHHLFLPFRQIHWGDPYALPNAI